MKRIFLLLLLVIVLVSLNWFKELFAQDLSSLSAAEKEAYVKKYQSSLSQAKPENNSYKTASIYDSTVETKLPVVSERVFNGAGQGKNLSDSSNQTVTESANLTDQKEGVLRPFGTELFNAPFESAPPNDIASSPDYILGPGDNVIIYLWGRVEKEFNLTIDREGKIFIPKVGEVLAYGMSLADFKTSVRRQLSEVYTEFDLNVSLGKIRSIRIYLTGEVNRPGAYTVSSLTSLFNALFLAGGPNEHGSMRAIRLMRNGVKVKEIDLYKFLLEGDNSLDTRLESGDAIFVPVSGARVAVSGKVIRPALYELRGGETALQVLALAGNATADAHLDRVMLERIADRDEWEVIDLNLRSDSAGGVSDLELLDGDKLTIFSVFESKNNMVSIGGMVKHPGYFERNDSTRISDLLGRSILQPYDVHFERANLFRRHTDGSREVVPVNLTAILAGNSEQNIILRDRDSLHVYSMSEVTREKYVQIEGEVHNPGKYPLYADMTVNDLVFLAGSFTRGASRLQAEIGRVDVSGEVSLQYISLNSEQVSLVKLEQDDRVYIRQIPQWRVHRTVVLEGEVNYPGEYLLSGEQETLYDLLLRAGGFSPSSFPKGTIFERKTISNNLDRLRVPSLLVKSSPMVKDSLGNISRIKPFEYDPSSVNRLVINMDQIVASEGKIGNVVLEPGDYIYIPATPSGISVLGAVSSDGTIKYQEKKNVSFYIKQAGNFSFQADKKGTNLIKANGSVYSGSGALGKRVEPGDVIVVPTKIQTSRDWTKTLTAVVTTTAGLLTTILLIDKL
ncbi:MAG: SLBB domain-containing protein [candidate division Zixibacteria bacterium]|nr:SLBB domain-containing protein [candidate division Zixibacteria bacterium]